MMQCRLPAHYTMRNTLKHYENKVCFELKQEMFYEKCRFQEVFLIRHSPDNLIFIKNHENMRNENEKSFVDRERLFYVTIYGR